VKAVHTALRRGRPHRHIPLDDETEDEEEEEEEEPEPEQEKDEEEITMERYTSEQNARIKAIFDKKRQAALLAELVNGWGDSVQTTEEDEDAPFVAMPHAAFELAKKQARISKKFATWQLWLEWVQRLEAKRRFKHRVPAQAVVLSEAASLLRLRRDYMRFPELYFRNEAERDAEVITLSGEIAKAGGGADLAADQTREINIILTQMKKAAAEAAAAAAAAAAAEEEEDNRLLWPESQRRPTQTLLESLGWEWAPAEEAWKKID